ncbi:unnamed protein product [Staurois parvus]|uniref:Transposase n=1 Tax=Staurois parvus TaxID=386267 RepID=A0ABN9ADU3_9NEOB|nr:unnamed protein product [Staurois parvus]
MCVDEAALMGTDRRHCGWHWWAQVGVHRWVALLAQVGGTSGHRWAELVGGTAGHRSSGH